MNGNTPPHSRSPSLSLCGNLHSMMSLFPIIPWHLPVPTKQSVPTPWPCQSHHSNLSKGQRPKSCSCVPIYIYIYVHMKLWWLQTPISLNPFQQPRYGGCSDGERHSWTKTTQVCLKMKSLFYVKIDGRNSATVFFIYSMKAAIITAQNCHFFPTISLVLIKEVFFTLLQLCLWLPGASHADTVTQYIKDKVQYVFENSLLLRILSWRLMTQQSSRTRCITVGLFTLHIRVTGLVY